MNGTFRPPENAANLRAFDGMSGLRTPVQPPPRPRLQRTRRRPCSAARCVPPSTCRRSRWCSWTPRGGSSGRICGSARCWASRQRTSSVSTGTAFAAPADREAADRALQALIAGQRSILDSPEFEFARPDGEVASCRASTTAVVEPGEAAPAPRPARRPRRGAPCTARRRRDGRTARSQRRRAHELAPGAVRHGRPRHHHDLGPGRSSNCSLVTEEETLGPRSGRCSRGGGKHPRIWSPRPSPASTSRGSPASSPRKDGEHIAVDVDGGPIFDSHAPAWVLGRARAAQTPIAGRAHPVDEHPAAAPVAAGGRSSALAARRTRSKARS